MGCSQSKHTEPKARSGRKRSASTKNNKNVKDSSMRKKRKKGNTATTTTTTATLSLTQVCGDGDQEGAPPGTSGSSGEHPNPLALPEGLVQEDSTIDESPKSKTTNSSNYNSGSALGSVSNDNNAQYVANASDEYLALQLAAESRSRDETSSLRAANEMRRHSTFGFGVQSAMSGNGGRGCKSADPHSSGYTSSSGPQVISVIWGTSTASSALSLLQVKEGLALHGTDDAGFDTINNYAIVEELGRGNFGKVMLACDEEGNQVAIKSMSSDVKAPKHRFARVASCAKGSLISRGQSSVHSLRVPSATASVTTTPVGAPVASLDASSQDSHPLDLGSRGPPAINGFSSTASAASFNRPMSMPTAEDTMVMREVAIMKKLRHKNIVQLKEVIHDEEEDMCHLVMDYKANGPLAEVNASGVCTSRNVELGDIEAAKKYIYQAASGLQYLHKHGIVHRDVKPENLLIGTGNDCCIADFGVSAVLCDHKVVDPSAGTPTFFSPELHSGNYDHAAKYGEESDVWALGVTFYAIVFGKVPFFAPKNLPLARSVLQDPVPLPTELAQDDPLRTIFEGVLHKDPTKRWTLKQLRKSIRPRKTSPSVHKERSTGDHPSSSSDEIPVSQPQDSPLTTEDADGSHDDMGCVEVTDEEVFRAIRSARLVVNGSGASQRNLSTEMLMRMYIK